MKSYEDGFKEGFESGFQRGLMEGRKEKRILSNPYMDEAEAARLWEKQGVNKSKDL